MAVDRRPDGPGRRDDIPNAAEYAGIGIQFAAAILIFLFAGRWLDDRLGTDPWLTVLGVFVGFGTSLYSVVRKLSPPARRDPRKKDTERP